MRDISHDPVIERLTCLEHTCPRWQVVGSLALALLALVALLGAVGRRDGDEVEELRARAFVLIDREGKPRMDLRVTGNDNTQLVLLDREGLPRMNLNIL